MNGSPYDDVLDISFDTNAADIADLERGKLGGPYGGVAIAPPPAALDAWTDPGIEAIDVHYPGLIIQEGPGSEECRIQSARLDPHAQ
jgi:hypothetical protein